MKRKKKNKQILNKVLRVVGRGKNPGFIEAGYVTNPTHKDEIYFMIEGKFVQECWKLRKDEALILIMCLSVALNKKITGLELK